MHRVVLLTGLLCLPTVLTSAEVKVDEHIRVGLIQMNARLHDKQYDLARAEKLIREATARGAKIVCTPEASVQGRKGRVAPGHVCGRS